MALHLYTCYRDFERARIQIAMAARSLSNNPDLLELTALIDRTQGRWEKSTSGLEKAANSDPRNPEVLELLVENYFALRRYKDLEEIQDRLTDLVQPDQLRMEKGDYEFHAKADVKRARAAYETLSPSLEDDPWFTITRCYYAMCDRD